MQSKLTFLNLAGVAALAVLCVFQWKQNTTLHQKNLESEKNGREQSEKLQEQKLQLDGLQTDLTRFKEQFASANKDSRENSALLKTAQRVNQELLVQTGQLRTSLSNWVQAASDRDTRISEANNQIAKLSRELNSTVEKYNLLASNYNVVVTQLNQIKVGGQTKDK
mgnify:CR=1 FL=1